MLYRFVIAILIGNCFLSITTPTFGQFPRPKLRIEFPQQVVFLKDVATKQKSQGNDLSRFELDGFSGEERYLPTFILMFEGIPAGSDVSLWARKFGTVQPLSDLFSNALRENFQNAKGQKKIRLAAAWWKLSRDPKAMDFLVSSLPTENGFVAAIEMRKMACRDAPVMKRVIELLKGDNPKVVAEFASQFVLYGEHERFSNYYGGTYRKTMAQETIDMLPEAIPSLVRLVEGGDRFQIRTLAGLGKASESATEFLATTPADSKESDVREMCFNALIAIDSEASINQALESFLQWENLPA